MIALAFLVGCATDPDPVVEIPATGQGEVGHIFRCYLPDRSFYEYCALDVSQFANVQGQVCNQTISDPLEGGPILCRYTCPSQPGPCATFNGCFCP
jgi:hypothetical protein